jgi:hypothetical protein
LLLAAGIAVLSLLLSACGTPPTRHGAPPFHDPTPQSTSPHLRTHFPGVNATVTYTALAGSDVAPVEAFVNYMVAYLHTLRTNQIDPALKTYASASIRQLVTSQRLLQTTLGYKNLGPYRVVIRSVNTVTGSVINACLHEGNRLETGDTVDDHADTATPVVALLAQRKTGAWYVAAGGSTRKLAKVCK